METTVEVLHPFFSLEKGARSYHYALRPLYNFESDRGEKKTHRLQYLWPLGLQSSKEDDLWLHRFWPLFLHTEKTKFFTGERAVHGFVFPLAYWGYKPPQGRYFALFPLGGVVHGLLGDTFSVVAFPH